jgi:hypothetical protein
MANYSNFVDRTNRGGLVRDGRVSVPRFSRVPVGSVSGFVTAMMFSRPSI